MTASDGKQTNNETDYTNIHFYLVLGSFPLPYVIAKKGSFTDLDLKDVGVDASLYTYNANEKKISFSKRVWLTEGLTYSMNLDGTFGVLELTDKTFVIKQKEVQGTTTYTFK